MIQDFKITFALGWPIYLIGGMTVLVLLAVLLFYLRAAGQVPRRYLTVLVILRLVAMLAILLSLFQPVISYKHGIIERTTLAVLLDSSRSMTVRDFPGQPGRFERARGLLLKPGGSMSRIEKNFDLLWHSFDRRARRVEERSDLAKLLPEGDVTDIVASVRDAIGNIKSADIGGVVMLTDGINTTAANVPDELRKLSVPFYTVGVGSVLHERENYRDISITRVEVNRELSVKTTNPVEVDVEAIGYANQVVPVILEEDGKEVAREQLVLDQKRGSQRVTMMYTPQEKGDFELTVRIPKDDAEQIAENNSASRPVFVSEPKIKVLYVEGVVRSEYRELHRVLEYDPNLEVISLIRVGKNLFNQQGNVENITLDGFPKTYEELNQFKVLIIGSLESSALSKTQMEFVRRFVKEGGGLMMIGGELSFGPGGYGGTPVEEALPVVCGRENIGQEREPFPLTLTAAGMAHPIFGGIEEFFNTTTRPSQKPLPDMLGCVRVASKKPLAEILAVNPKRRTAKGELIAIAAGKYGGGRAIAATIDSTHLWYMPMKGMGKDSPYVRYWGQSMRWLAGLEETRRSTEAGVIAYVDEHFYKPGARPFIRAEVTDRDGQATDRAVVKAVIEAADGRAPWNIQLALVQGGRGEYTAKLKPMEPGKYQATVWAKLEGDNLGEHALKLRVGEPTREYEKLDLDEESLRDIAQRSGGLYFSFLSFDQLEEQLRARQERKLKKVEIFLWNLPFLFIAFILLVTSEWILRKRRLLS